MKKIIVILCSLALFVSCKKDPPQEEVPGQFENGIFVLNEGLFQQNNASISFYSNTEEKVYQQVFQNVNGRGLGDTANEFERYSLNGKDYIIICVDVSSQVEIVDANTMESLAQIPLFDGSNAREPRRVVVQGQNAFVCNFDGTVSVIDLNNGSEIQTISVGLNPDGLILIGNKLYVSNSGGLNYPAYDSTITVINTSTFQVIDTFETRINSSQMILDQDNEIYLHSSGDYASVGPAIVRINTDLNQVVQIFDLPVGPMASYQDMIYFYDSDVKGIRRLNMASETVESAVIVDCSNFTTFHDFIVNQVNGKIYCMDAMNYTGSSIIKIFSSTGVKEGEFVAGLNATDIIFN